MTNNINYPSCRSASLECGNKFYYTGKPCKKGHYSKRYTSNKGCYECVRSKDAETNRKHKENKEANWTEFQLKRRNREYKREYGITYLQYRHMVMTQDYKCAICGVNERFMEIEDWKQKGWLGDLVVDHCHETKKVRGAICHNCNTGIGNLKHDKKILSKAIRYLER